MNILSGSAAPPDMTITMPVSDVTSHQQLHITMKSVGRTQYFLNPYTYTNNHPDEVRTEFYNLRSNGNLEQILIKSRRRNSCKARVSPGVCY